MRAADIWITNDDVKKYPRWIIWRFWSDHLTNPGIHGLRVESQKGVGREGKRDPVAGGEQCGTGQRK